MAAGEERHGPSQYVHGPPSVPGAVASVSPEKFNAATGFEEDLDGNIILSRREKLQGAFGLSGFPRII